MVEIEDRGINYKSNKMYIKALHHEIRALQQLLPSDDVKRCFDSVVRAVKSGKIKGEVTDFCLSAVHQKDIEERNKVS